MDDKKPLILLVDDSEEFREIFSMRLGASGFEVVTASDGAEGLEKLKSIKPDLVLLDMQMPGMNGIETIEKIKSNPDTRNLKVVFLTNYGEPHPEHEWTDKQFSAQIGAEDYIRKSDDLNEIVEHIKNHAQPTSYISR